MAITLQLLNNQQAAEPRVHNTQTDQYFFNVSNSRSNTFLGQQAIANFNKIKGNNSNKTELIHTQNSR
jgi:hypothetical protein